MNGTTKSGQRHCTCKRRSVMIHQIILQSASGAIDAGAEISGITDGYSGSAPDIGAYEAGGADWTAGQDFGNPPNPAFTTTEIPYHTLLG